MFQHANHCISGASTADYFSFSLANVLDISPQLCYISAAKGTEMKS
jgi:hypothetical protein